MMPAIELDAVVVGDDAHAPVEAIGPAVERDDLLARTRPPHDEVALDLSGIENVERAASIEGDVVGDVDKGIDGAQPDRREPALHPVGA